MPVLDIGLEIPLISVCVFSILNCIDLAVQCQYKVNRFEGISERKDANEEDNQEGDHSVDTGDHHANQKAVRREDSHLDEEPQPNEKCGEGLNGPVTVISVVFSEDIHKDASHYEQVHDLDFIRKVA